MTHTQPGPPRFQAAVLLVIGPQANVGAGTP